MVYNSTTNDLMKRLLKEGCGIRSISRILGISTKTILSRMLKIGKEVQLPQSIGPGLKYEVDELWSFIGRKSNAVWITYAIERETRRIMGFCVGNKTKTNIRPLINKLLSFDPKRIYTDGLNIYPRLIPKEVHGRFQYCTNCIERNNLTMRTHIKRLARRTICFSKSKTHLEAHLKIYFWG